MFYIAFYINLTIQIMILNLSLLLSFLRLLRIFVDVLKVAKTLTFETSLISLSMETGVFPKPIAIELPPHQ
jgi:hypothetical protein